MGCGLIMSSVISKVIQIDKTISEDDIYKIISEFYIQNIAEDKKRITELEKKIELHELYISKINESGIIDISKGQYNITTQRAIILKNAVYQNGSITTKQAKSILKLKHHESVRRTMKLCNEIFDDIIIVKLKNGHLNLQRK